MAGRRHVAGRAAAVAARPTSDLDRALGSATDRRHRPAAPTDRSGRVPPTRRGRAAIRPRPTAIVRSATGPAARDEDPCADLRRIGRRSTGRDSPAPDSTAPAWTARPAAPIARRSGRARWDARGRRPAGAGPARRGRGARRRPPAGGGGVRRAPARDPAARRAGSPAGARAARAARDEPADPGRGGRGRHADGSLAGFDGHQGVALVVAAAPLGDARRRAGSAPASAASRRSCWCSTRSRIPRTWARCCAARRPSASTA